jgi:hypothetical protein
MQTHCSLLKGFRTTKLNAKKVHKYSTKKLVDHSSVIIIIIFKKICSCARFGGHQNLESYRVNRVQI